VINLDISITAVTYENPRDIPPAQQDSRSHIPQIPVPSDVNADYTALLIPWKIDLDISALPESDDKSQLYQVIDDSSININP